MLPERQNRDLADLLYFLAGDEGKFPLRMQTVIQRKGNLDYIPPMRNGQNLLGITWEEWRSLFQRIEELGKYEYVILDLSESIQGLLDVLQMCIKVFTLTREDKMSQCKLDQYEQLLSLCEKEDQKAEFAILSATSRGNGTVYQRGTGRLCEKRNRDIGRVE